MGQGISYSANACINFLVPPRCVNCNRLSAVQDAICANCWVQLRFIERPYCEIMGTPFSVDLGEGTLSTEAMANPPPFSRLRSAVLYNDIARNLISRFKFSDRNDLAPFIANVMARAGSELIGDADIIIPLPLHRRRLHSRRFNQSAELARIISAKSETGNRHVPCDPMALSRVRNTRQQIGLTRQSRQQNVSGAFLVPTHMRPRLAGKRILLVDDIYTSGASVKSATKALLRGGAKAVDILTFAKVHSGII
jgi:ComF family protein